MRNRIQHLSLSDLQKQINRQKELELLFGPEVEILKKQSDQFLDSLHLEMELRDGISKISDVILLVPRKYEAIFHKEWFYRLADMLGVDRKVMDTYVKPKYVRTFFIDFVYARLTYKVYRELKAARRIARAHNAKLFQFLQDEYVKLIENIAKEIFREMEGKNYEAFATAYRKEHKLADQIKLF